MGQLVTSGGRVLGVTATGPTLRQALHDAYAAARAVDFDGKYLRHDIGQRGSGGSGGLKRIFSMSAQPAREVIRW